MQYLVARYGHEEWISDGVPSSEAVDAALLVELSNRLGVDWQEAIDVLDGEAPDDAEREAAQAEVKAMADEAICKALLRQMADYRTYRAATRSKVSA